MKNVIVDTDIISYFFRSEKKVVEKINNHILNGGSIYLCAVTFYELKNGLIYKDSKNMLDKLQTFVEVHNVLPLTHKGADISARIYSDLRKSGVTIGHTDILIAGTAIENDLILITNNTKHFSPISELEIDNWAV